MNILNIIRSLKIKQNEYYANNPLAFWVHSTITLLASGWTFVKTIKSINKELDDTFEYFSLFPY